MADAGAASRSSRNRKRQRGRYIYRVISHEHAHPRFFCSSQRIYTLQIVLIFLKTIFVFLYFLKYRNNLKSLSY